MGDPHPLTAGVTIIPTRHLGPYKRALRVAGLPGVGERLTLFEAAVRAGELDRRCPQSDDDQGAE